MRWNEKKFSFYFTAEKRLKVYRWIYDSGLKPIVPGSKIQEDRLPKHPHPVLEPYFIIQIPVVKISGGLEHTETTDDYWIPQREMMQILEHYNDSTKMIPIIREETA